MMLEALRRKHTRGISLVEVLIGAALVALVFGALFQGVQLMVEVITHSKAEAGARSLSVERMEFIRSLDYDSVGTVAGIPSGTLEQNATTTLNGITYSVRTLVQFIDRVQDGFGAVDNTIPGVLADGNGILEDSKIVKLTYSWTLKGETRDITMVSDLIPKGIESTAGGGTLLINVFDAQVLPVEGAEVRVVNNSLSSPVDVTVFTNANGMANFPGAPAGANYEIRATKSGYSTDQTYSVTATNTSPIRTHISVATGSVSTVNFEIDRLSDLTIRTVGEPTRTTFVDSFSGTGSIAATSSVEITGGGVVLEGGPSSYASLGTVFADRTSPVVIDYWEALNFNATTTANTDVRIRLYSVSGTGSTTVYTEVPDGDLPGNAVGFTSGPVNVSGLSTSTYTELAIGGTLTSSSTSETPEIYDWQLSYVESQPAIGSIPFDIDGAKSIGTYLGQPVLKYSSSDTTGGDGSLTIEDLEFDDYDITLTTGSYTVSEVYGGNPYGLAPGVDETVTFVLSSPTTYSLRVEVEDDSANPIAGASVRLTDTGYDVTQITSIHGQTHFNSGLASSTSYTIEVTATGYDPVTVTDFAITGNEETTIQLPLEGAGTPPPGGGGTTTSTYLAGYDTRIPLSIVGTVLFGNVSDFPVYVDLSSLPASFFTSVQSNGADIRVTENDGLSEVPFELVAINTGAQTGQLHFKAPSLLTSTTTVFYMYYGSSTASAYAASDTYGSQNVWTNNYRAVYHLEEAQAGTGGTDIYRDSTSAAAHGDDDVAATDKTGQLGLGQEFNDSNDDNIELPYTVLDGQTDVTVSYWYRTDSNDYMTVLSGARDNTGDGANEYLLWYQDRNDVQFFSHGDPRVNFDIFNINDNAYRYYVSVRDDTNNQTRFYIDANEDDQSPANDTMSALSIAPGGLFIGVDQDSIGGSFGQELDGELDELRISSGVRSGSWISNTFLNQNAPGTFYTVGSEETE